MPVSLPTVTISSEKSSLLRAAPRLMYIPARARPTQVSGRPARQKTLTAAEKGAGNLRGTGANLC